MRISAEVFCISLCMTWLFIGLAGKSVQTGLVVSQSWERGVRRAVLDLAKQSMIIFFLHISFCSQLYACGAVEQFLLFLSKRGWGVYGEWRKDPKL